MKKFKPNDIWENLFLSKLFLFASLTCTCVNQVHKFPVYCFRRCLREDVRRPVYCFRRCFREDVRR